MSLFCFNVSFLVPVSLLPVRSLAVQVVSDSDILSEESWALFMPPDIDKHDCFKRKYWKYSMWYKTNQVDNLYIPP